MRHFTGSGLVVVFMMSPLVSTLKWQPIVMLCLMAFVLGVLHIGATIGAKR